MFAFWKCICTKKVSSSVVRNETMLALPGHDESGNTLYDAKWGPTWYSHVIVERAEYRSLWDTILGQNETLKMIKVEGSKGIGKSVFSYWLLYKLVCEAKTHSRPIPSVMMIRSVGGDGEKAYSMLRFDSGVASETVMTSIEAHHTQPDYVISDGVFDLVIAPKYWKLLVTSYGSADPKDYTSGVQDVKEIGLTRLISPCTLSEIVAIFPDAHEQQARFAYTVFGGSARLCGYMLAPLIEGEDTVYFPMVQEAMVAFFAHTEYEEGSEEFIRISSGIIANEINKLIATATTVGSKNSDVIYHSVFQHTTRAPAVTGIGPHHHAASTFMGYLAHTIVEKERDEVLKQLAELFTRSGVGFLFEAQVHKFLWRMFNNGNEVEVKRLYPSTAAPRTATSSDMVKLQPHVTRKVFFRNIEDIARLPANVLGVPTVPNLALVDFVVKGADCGLEFNATIAKGHAGAKKKHPEIELGMGTASSNNMMIFCCDNHNFERFDYVDGLVQDVKQYKMRCEWTVNKKQKTEE